MFRTRSVAFAAAALLLCAAFVMPAGAQLTPAGYGTVTSPADGDDHGQFQGQCPDSEGTVAEPVPVDEANTSNADQLDENDDGWICIIYADGEKKGHADNYYEDDETDENDATEEDDEDVYERTKQKLEDAYEAGRDVVEGAGDALSDVWVWPAGS
jgi:hypothetical protein